MKRRVLHKLKITDISSVDFPCQEHARMVIMKRAPAGEARTLALGARLLKLQDSADLLKAQLDAYEPPVQKFWGIAARLAAQEARRRLMGGKKGFFLDATHQIVRHEAKHRLKRGARRAAIAGGVGGAAYLATRRSKSS